MKVLAARHRMRKKVHVSRHYQREKSQEPDSQMSQSGFTEDQTIRQRPYDRRGQYSILLIFSVAEMIAGVYVTPSWQHAKTRVQSSPGQCEWAHETHKCCSTKAAHPQAVTVQQVQSTNQGDLSQRDIEDPQTDSPPQTPPLDPANPCTHHSGG